MYNTNDNDTLTQALAYLGWKGGTVWGVHRELLTRTSYRSESMDVFTEIREILDLLTK